MTNSGVWPTRAAVSHARCINAVLMQPNLRKCSQAVSHAYVSKVRFIRLPDRRPCSPQRRRDRHSSCTACLPGMTQRATCHRDEILSVPANRSILKRLADRSRSASCPSIRSRTSATLRTTQLSDRSRAVGRFIYAAVRLRVARHCGGRSVVSVRFSRSAPRVRCSIQPSWGENCSDLRE
jgi:hypothetical protein